MKTKITEMFKLPCPSQFNKTVLCSTIHPTLLSVVQGLSHTPVNPLVHVSADKPPKDVFSEALEDPLNDPSGTEPKKPVNDVKGAASVEIDLFADPLGESGAQPAPPKSKSSAAHGEANSKGVGASQNDVKKSKDIFKESPKHGTIKTDPRPLGGGAGGQKAPSTDLFGDDDDESDDLFEEPLQAAAKKPQAKETSKGTMDKSKDATSALLTEEVIRVPPASAASKPAKPSTDPGSKPNGLHSDEDDLFTGTVCNCCDFIPPDSCIFFKSCK